MTPSEYCQQKAAQSGSSFYYSFLFLPEDKRQAIIALYAFCREVDDVVDNTSDINLARTKLAWWRSEIDNMYQHQPTHPVTQALAPVLKEIDLPRIHMLEVIQGMEMDLETHNYADFEQLKIYCYHAASSVGLLSARIFGYQQESTLQYAQDLGMAFQLTNIIRDVYEDAQRGRFYLPADELEKFGVSQTDILQQRYTESFYKLMRFQAERAHSYYEQAFQYLAETDRYAQRAGIVMSAIYRTLLQEIENDGFKVLSHRTSLPPLRKLWLAWRTLRQEKKRYKKYRANKL